MRAIEVSQDGDNISEENNKKNYGAEGNKNWQLLIPKKSHKLLHTKTERQLSCYFINLKQKYILVW